MSNNNITTDIISRRLGQVAQRPAYQADEPEDVIEVVESTNSSPGFMIMMLVLFLVVGVGTFFFADSDLSWYDLKLAISRWSPFKS
jgi:hypothetical protein